MSNVDINLIRALDGAAPQHKVSNANKFELSEGSDGAQHVKIVDSEGNVQDKISVELPDKQIVTVDNQIQLPTDYPDKAVEARLQAIESKQQAILDKLESGLDTRLTGSNVEDGILTKSKGTLVEIGRVTNYTMSPGSIRYSVIRGGILSEKFFVGIREADGIRHDFDIELAFYDSETNSGLYGYGVMKKIENSHTATTEHMPIMGNEIGIGIRNRDDIEHKYNIVVWGVG